MPTIVIDDPSITVVLEDLSEIVVQTLSNGGLTVIGAGSFSMGGGIISNHGTPVNPADVITKSYTEGYIAGLIGVTIQGYSLALQNTTASFTTALETKLNGIVTVGVENFTTALKAKLDAIEAGATIDQNAAEVNYSNVGSGLAATTSQGAIDEIDTTVDSIRAGTTSITFNNTISSLAAITLKTAIDETVALTVANTLAINVLTAGTLTATGSVVITDKITRVSASTLDIDVTLPTAIGNANKMLIVKRVDTTSKVVTLFGFGSQTIDGVLSGTLANKDSITLVSDGSNWDIV